MKVEYLCADVEKNQGPRYIFRPETHEEQKVLTILRDLMLRTKNRLRMIGAEEIPKKVADMPARPVIAAGFCLETVSGKIPEDCIPRDVDPFDVNRFVHASEQGHKPSAIAAGKKGMRVVNQNTPRGPSTVVEEG